MQLGAFNDAANAFSPIRVPLEPDTFISPGYPYTFSFTLTAPCTPGTYELQYRLVKNNGEWFGDTLTVTIVVQTCGQAKVGKTTVCVASSTAHDLLAGREAGIVTGTGLSLNSGPADFSSLQAKALERYSTSDEDSARERLLARVLSGSVFTTLAGVRPSR